MAFVEPCQAVRLPLTPNQADIWLAQKLRPHTSQFNISPYYLIPLAVDETRFLAAADRVFASHEALYARLAEGAGDVPELLFDPANAPRCEFIDLSSAADPEQELQSLLTRRARTPFALADVPLSRPALIKTGPQAYCYACEHFHLVMDGWGAAIVFQRIAQTYEALGAGREPPAAGVPYSDFMRQSAAPAELAAMERSLAFWQPLLAEPFPQLPPRYRLSAGEDEQATACVTVSLSRALADRVTARIAPHGATLFHAAILAFNHLLARQYGIASPPVALPILNRDKQHKDTPGFFVETRTLPVPLDEKAPVSDNLRAVARRIRELFRHYRVPARELTRLYQAQGGTDIPAGLSSISYITRDFAAGIDGQEIPMTDRPPAHEALPFLFYFLDIYAGQDLRLELIYRKQYANADDARLLLQRFIHLLEAVASDPSRTLGEIDLIPPAESRRIAANLCREAEYRAAPGLVPDAFLARAAKSPDAIAIESGGRRHTYRECADRARTIAHTLAHDHGVRPGDRVLVLMPRSAELVAGELGVMLAGATFVPIDPHGPEPRARQIGENARAQCLLTISPLAGKARSIHEQVIAVDALARDAVSFPSRTAPDQIAYIIYTSGSTGQPKGVEIPQRELADHCAAWVDAIPLREGKERVLLFSSPAFDASIEYIYPSLLGGGTLVMAPHPPWMPHELGRILVEQRITVGSFSPAYLMQFLKHARETPGRLDGHTMHLGVVGGDVLPAEAAPLWDEVFGVSATLFNIYGPTEVTATATYFAVPPGYRAEPGESIPVGRPYRGRTLRILDERRRALPVGAEGELYIGGLGLAKGYHGRPEETSARFVTLDDGRRYYRSGDVVRLRTDGQIVFRRRLDRQVKLRGFRIEPGEIEACLHAHRAVAECAVVVLPDTSGQSSELRAFASLLTNANTGADELRAHLRAHLPDYMIPTLVLLDRLPKNTGGKIDRVALQQLPAAELPAAHAGPTPQTPEGPVQEYLALLWQEALGAPAVDVHADFFVQGGHSLLAARFIANVSRSFRREFPFADFFNQPTIAATASRLEELVGDRERLEKMALVRLELMRLSPGEIRSRLANLHTGKS